MNECPKDSKLADRIEIEIVPGDITESACDAIVNAANNHLWMGSGVAGAIKRKGGDEIEKEAIAKGPIQPGKAVATGAGKLAAKYVIHAAGMGQDLRTSEQLIRQSTLSSLVVADNLGLESIAFPAIGTGVGGFKPYECAKIMIDTVMGYPTSTLKIVEFVLFNEKSVVAFEKALSEYSL